MYKMSKFYFVCLKLRLLSLFQHLIIEVLTPQEKVDKWGKCLTLRENSSWNYSNFFWNIEIYRAFFEENFVLHLYLAKSLTWELFHLLLGTRWTSQDWKCLQGQHIRTTSGGNDFILPYFWNAIPKLVANPVPGFNSFSFVFLHSSGSKLKSSVLPLIRSYRIPCLW